MLIVCNGALKSGSTWLYNVVLRLLKCDLPDAKYLTQGKQHPTIRPEMLRVFLETEDFASRDLITKTHYGQRAQRELILSHPNTFVIDMARNSRDVIVSAYYDACRRHGFRGDFRKFYWFAGRSQAEYLNRYHEVWAEPHARVLVTSFEGLKTRFAEEAGKIARFLDVQVSDRDISRIEEETSIDNLRSRYSGDPQYVSDDGSFFRKGIIGDWQNHFDASMVRDISRIEQDGIARFDIIELRNRARRRVYSLFPALSPYRPTREKS